VVREADVGRRAAEQTSDRKQRTGVTIRAAALGDLPRLTEIYNHYIEHTAITFDVAPYTVERRRDEWFSKFHESGRHRLLVAVDHTGVLAYAGTMQFRTKAAYETTVETTIYCAPEATGLGLGGTLYTALFEALRDEDIHMIVAGITMPNPVSVKLHERFGFLPAGVFHGVGRKFGKYWDVAWYEKPLT
jgi:phosphinothricin acetyltransferase